MGYHVRDITKGIIGDFSKIQEEWDELMDARLQGAKLLELVELSDLLGAIDAYVRKSYNLTLDDVAVMAEMTSSAFKEGKRT